MIEPSSGPSIDSYTSRAAPPQGASRMAGANAAWKTALQEQQRPQQALVEQLLTAATTGDTARSTTISAAAMAYQNVESAPVGEPSQEFGFADLIDMVNPLQHIPIVSHIYRKITGDTIKPIGQIVGGAVFGGPVGAVGGLVNAVVEKETGRDLTGNAIAMLEGEEIKWQDHPASAIALAEAQLGPRNAVPEAAPDSSLVVSSFAPSQTSPAAPVIPVTAESLAEIAPAAGLSGPSSPEIALTHAAFAIERAAYRDLPPALLGFADSAAALPPALPTREESARYRPRIHNSAATGWRQYERYND